MPGTGARGRSRRRCASSRGPGGWSWAPRSAATLPSRRWSCGGRGAPPPPAGASARAALKRQADRAVARELHLSAERAVDAALGNPESRGATRQTDPPVGDPGPGRPSGDVGQRRGRRQRSPPARRSSLHPSAPMTKPTLDFLKRLLDTPGPSGFETAPARVWRDEVKGFADEVKADVHGNSIAAINPKGTPRLMFAGHIDEIGLQVTHVDDEGYVYFAAIGGWDPQVLVGQRVMLLGPAGPVRGVIGKKAVHMMKKEELDKVSKVDDLWIDVGAADKAEALGRVHVGDPGVLDGAALDFPNGRLVSRSIDNRIGAYVVAEALRLLAKDRPKHAAVFAVATVQEEIAWAGGGARTSAVGLDPQVALVVDVTHATDWPGAEKKLSGDHKLGGGPVFSRGSATHPKVFELLVACADEEKIPYTIQAAPRDTGTDADAISNTMRGIPTGLVSVPNRYMHTPNEMVALVDLERAARLLAAFARKLTPDISFIP